MTIDRRDLVARAMYETPGHLYKRNVTWDDTGIKGLDENTIRLSIKQQFHDMAASVLAALEPWLIPELPDGHWVEVVEDQITPMGHFVATIFTEHTDKYGIGPTIPAAIRAALERGE